MAAVFVLLALALFAYYRKDLDAIRPETLAARVKSTVTTYYDRNGKVLWEDKGTGDYELVVDGDKINTYMREATVAIEDKEFYQLIRRPFQAEPPSNPVLILPRRRAIEPAPPMLPMMRPFPYPLGAVRAQSTRITLLPRLKTAS